MSGTYYTNSEIKSKSELKRSSLILPKEFHFWNGDEYKGEFSLLKEKQKFIMEGEGVYTTGDGHIYEGTWSDDTLVNKCKITFPDKSVFSGFLEDMVIQGPGEYTFKEEVKIEGNFLNNYPEGRISLKDSNNHVWGGVVKEDEPLVDFYLVHPYWMSLLEHSSPEESVFYGETDEEIASTWDDNKSNYMDNKFI